MTAAALEQGRQPEDSDDEDEDEDGEDTIVKTEKRPDEGVAVNTAMSKIMSSFSGVTNSAGLDSLEENALRRAVLAAIRAVWDEWDLLSGQITADDHDDVLNVLRPDSYQHEQNKRLPQKVKSDYDARQTGTSNEIENNARVATGDIHRDENVPTYATEDSAATFVHASTELDSSAAMFPRKERAVTRRAGLGSHFLHKSVHGDTIPVAIRPVRHFRLPFVERRAPLVMIACGGGIATFRGFMEERMRLRNQRGVEVGEMWLLWGARSRAHLSYRAEIEHFVEEELATVQVALSHEDYEFKCELNNNGELDSRITEGGQFRSLQSLLESSDVQAKLWHWLQADAIIYVAGQGTGVGIVRDAISKAANRAQPSDPEFGTRYVQALVADRRIRMDVTAAVSF